MDEAVECIKNPLTASAWKELSPLAQQCLCLLVDAAQAGHLEMYNGVIAITVRQRHAITINPTAELRPGHEIGRPPPRQLYSAAQDRSYPEGAGPAKEALPPQAGARPKIFDARHVETEAKPKE